MTVRGVASQFLATAVILIATAALAAPRTLHHDLDVTLRLDRRELRGTDILTVSPEGAARLDLNLAPQARVRDVVVGGENASFTFKAGSLAVTVPRGLRSGTLMATVSYDVAFTDPFPVRPIDTDNPGYGVQGTIFDQGVFILDGAGWYPEIAGSRPTFRLVVRAPAGIIAVTAGRLVLHDSQAGTTTSTWEVRQPLAGLSLSAGPYHVSETEAGRIKIYTYFSAENTPWAERYLNAAAKYIRMYEGLLGPYPFEKFAVVENFFPTGYGFPSYTLLGSSIIPLPFILDTSLGHEIAHSWWGNGVLVDFSRGNWSEGLATYVADYLYREMSSSSEAAEYRTQILRDYATLVPPEADFPLRLFRSRTDLVTRAVGYGKGAMVFHMARRLVGDQEFWEALRDVCRDKMFQEASWDDFAAAMEKRGKLSLAAFFDQWVSRQGAPVLGIRDIKTIRLKDAWKIQGVIVQKKPYFAVELPILLETDGVGVSRTIAIHGGETAFEILSKHRPCRLIADPDAEVFRRMDRAEIPPTVNSLKASKSLIIVLSGGLSEEVRASVEVLRVSLGQQNALVLDEREATADRLRRHDVVFVGLPREKGLVPPLPPDFTLGEDRFAAAGVVYGHPQDALFGVFNSSGQPGHITALFLPLAAVDSGMIARKITHYGKYSYLAFHEREVAAKGLLQALSSPLSLPIEVRE